MPEATATVAPTSDLELENDALPLEDNDDDENDDDDNKEEKRTRMTLDDDENTYVFPVSKDVREDEEKVKLISQSAKDGINALIYTNGEPVEGFRVWNIEKNDQTVAFVLARTKQQACEIFLEKENDYTVGLAFKKRKGKRGKTKIDYASLQYGKMLEMVLFNDGKEANGFKENVNDSQKNDWNTLYAKHQETPSRFAHYRDAEGEWKDAN